jgi:hypothetical protein
MFFVLIETFVRFATETGTGSIVRTVSISESYLMSGIYSFLLVYDRYGSM